MSAWIESHQTLWRHPRKDALAEALYAGTVPDDVADAAAIGVLHKLWWWAMDYAQDGDLSPFSDRQIAKACDWRGDPAVFVDALLATGFVNEDRTIHDWHDYAGRLIERREKDRLRKAEKRAETTAQDVRRKSSGQDAERRSLARAHTEPNPTEPNPTKDQERCADAVAPAVADEDFEEWWAAYGKVGSRADAERLYRFWRTKGAEREDLLTAARVYRSHCERTDCKMQHARTFLAKPPKGARARWYEWAEGEEHGAMDVNRTTHLNDVLAAGAEAFGLTGGSDERGRLGTGERRRPAGVAVGGAPPGRGLPAPELAG